MFVPAERQEARRSRSRGRKPFDAFSRRPRADELDEAWRIADAEKEAELRSRERDLARREKELMERERVRRRQVVRSPPARLALGQGEAAA